MTIYRSSYHDTPVVQSSIFTHLLGESKPGYVGNWPGSHPAFTDAVTGTTISRSQTKLLALSLGYALRNHPTIRAKRGDVALIYSPNSIAWPVVLFGSVAAGLRPSFANNAYTSHELAHQYKDSGANLVFATEDGLPVVRKMFQELGLGKDADRRIIVLGDSLRWAGGPDAPRSPSSDGLLHLEDLVCLGSLAKEEMFEGEASHETAILCYSSGTTGKPKGVETTHLNLTSVTEMVLAILPQLSGTTSLGFLPFYHIYGCVQLLFHPLRAGQCTVIMQRFDPELYCKNIERYKISFSLVVPPVLVALARHPAVEKYNLTSLKLIFSGAAPLSANLTEQVGRRLRSVKVTCPILQGYGLTEMSPTTHVVEYKKAAESAGSIGALVPNLEARLVDEEGVDVRVGEPGELWMRGPTVMKGYLNNATATANAITQDGWFQTGDVAIRNDAGLYYIVDRRKELIKYKGFQVPPAELESVLLSHPDIADAAVIGITDHEKATELPRAYVVPAFPERVRTEAMKAKFSKSVAIWMEGKVARHKFLRGGVVIIDAVPKSAAGKILRRELRERAKTEVFAAPLEQAKL